MIGLLFISAAAAQEAPRKRLALLPFRNIGIDSVSGQTAGSILRMEVEKTEKYELLPVKKMTAVLPDEPCEDLACALEIGTWLNVEQVLNGSMAVLGEKIIVQYTLIDIALQKTAVQDRLTAATLEDLDMVTNLDFITAFDEDNNTAVVFTIGASI